MNDELTRACVGLHWLFDSTAKADHEQAKAICATCPALMWCVERTESLKKGGAVQRYALSGTWAGQLYGDRRTSDVIARENALYSHLEAKRARNAADAGDTSEWALLGRRVYQRRKRVDRNEEAGAK